MCEVIWEEWESVCGTIIIIIIMWHMAERNGCACGMLGSLGVCGIREECVSGRRPEKNKSQIKITNLNARC
tara:strand:+ start:189 stop:401 length:213 start_codon:yes stop_codon:yes gene_type:complete